MGNDRARFLYASVMRQMGDVGPNDADEVVGFHGKQPESTTFNFVVDGEVVPTEYERLELIEFDRRMSDEDIREWFQENDAIERWTDEDGFYSPDDSDTSDDDLEYSE